MKRILAVFLILVVLLLVSCSNGNHKDNNQLGRWILPQDPQMLIDVVRGRDDRYNVTVKEAYYDFSTNEIKYNQSDNSDIVYSDVWIVEIN